MNTIPSLSDINKWNTIDIFTSDVYNIPVQCISCTHEHLKFPCLLVSNTPGLFNYDNFFCN